MNTPIHPQYNWIPLSSPDKHCFFGYYDRQPWNQAADKHLALRVDQCDHVPLPGETAEVGYVSRDGSGFVKLAETRSWCHQQGAMTLWLKHLDNSFIYNDFDLKPRRMTARVFTLGSGITGQYDMPIYAMSPDGRLGVSINFSRIPRRGYSYADATLPEQRHPDLDRDGVFLIDMPTGKATLIASYRQLIDIHPMPFELDELYLWLNHAIFNCDSSKILFLFRSCADTSSPWPWKTHMYTVNTDGSDLACTLPHFYWNGMISHQIWGRTPNEVLIDADWRGRGSEYLVFDNRKRPLQAQLISSGMQRMGHLVFSPDGEWMLADTYPKDDVQTLALVKVATGEHRVIGNFRHHQPPGTPVDVRCDLHPRWSPDGSLITVDSIHGGNRNIHMLEFNDHVKF